MSRLSEAECGSKHVFDILNKIYPIVQSLEEFADGVVFADGRKAVLLEKTDSVGFTKALREITVCSFAPPPQQQFPSQDCTLQEILAFTLNHIKQKKLRNVLGFGYCCPVLMRQDPLQFHGDLSLAAASISTSGVWKRISLHLGTTITRFLLLDCAVFTTAPPSCLMQVCGEPINDLIAQQSMSGFSLSHVSDKMCKSVVISRQPPVVKKKNDTDHIVMRKRRRNERLDDYDDFPAEKRRRQLEADKTIRSLGSQSWKPADLPPTRLSNHSVRVLSMLYFGCGLKSFLLNRKVEGVGVGARLLQGEDLIRRIFLQSELSKVKNPKKLPKRFFKMVPLFSRLLQQHRKCRYWVFLSKKCGGTPDSKDMRALLKAHMSPYRVYLFVRECLNFVVPEEFWGSRENKRHFLSSVNYFLRLGKFEQLPLVQLMCKIKVKPCRWLGLNKRVCASEHRYCEWILTQFLCWLLNDFVIGLIRAQFYVTESMSHKRTLRFYRADVWRKLENSAVRDHLSNGQWRELSPCKAGKLPQDMATSRIRFIPKSSSSMRAIAPHKRGRDSLQVPALQNFKSCVRVLQAVLSVCVREVQGSMGSAVSGCLDIQQRLRDFCQHQKFLKGRPPLYFVKVYMSGAFDRLPHPKLMEVLDDLLVSYKEQSFFLHQYVVVWNDPHLGMRTRCYTKAELSHPLNMKAFIANTQLNGSVHDAILVEQSLSEVTAGDVLSFFRKMVTSYFICHHKRMFQQVRGIPQGSCVSALLRDICYSHMEKSELQNISRKGCLMRMVDDFLFITPHLSKAIEFLGSLLIGVPSYGCKVNTQKVAVNFPVCEQWVDSGVSVLPSSCMFSWCGLMINTHSLDVSKDYSRYTSLSLRYSLTLVSAISPCAIKKKLLSVLCRKSTNFFLDLQLHSVEAVHRNLYKLILLQAFRFHACVRSLPLGQSMKKSPRIFLEMIWTMSRAISQIVQNVNKAVPGCSADAGPLQSQAVQLYFCLAFETVFRSSRSLYRRLIPALIKRRRRVQRELCEFSLARVCQASTPRIPPDFRSLHK
ncbi:hypothetical protein DNTS_028820 [Danionella cerebrum]|uniref:Telomerase reverse transcriptase n=1 Tax=Danionella cerebrum TaxID=2873325 RepID=A0A553RQJ4_9TELE|nr:hypothetical protein DNTS_028820 [Danionella translucida]